AEDGIRDFHVTGVQTCALPISRIPMFKHSLSRSLAAIALGLALAACSPSNDAGKAGSQSPGQASSPAQDNAGIEQSVQKLFGGRSEERRVGKAGAAWGAGAAWK